MPKITNFKMKHFCELHAGQLEAQRKTKHFRMLSFTVNSFRDFVLGGKLHNYFG